MADEEDDAQKTEEPSSRKLERARSRGQVTTSQELKHWGVLIAVALGFAAMAPGIAFDVRALNARIIEKSFEVSVDADNIINGAVPDNPVSGLSWASCARAVSVITNKTV